MQGVGFRPFICRLAARHGLSGEVDNRSNGVSVIVQCDIKTIDRFSNDILENAPPASQIKSIEVKQKLIVGYSGFSISPSKVIDDQITEVSPDIAVCPDCLNDLNCDPERKDYPFINCTNCGPRFSITVGLPYDRPRTSMSGFIMCPGCEADYNDILNRRFHAQPIACNKCGPLYSYHDTQNSHNNFGEILELITRQVSSGETVAIKGLGGYHLMCDALNNEAVLRLRRRKNREAKPFAVMFRDLSAVKEYCHIEQEEMKELISWRRPVVILQQKKPLCESVSNGLDTTGAMLPYMPVHYLLFRELATPAVVLTSGNLSDEPIITDDDLAMEKLSEVAGSVVTYNRKIVNRADDSVVRIIQNRVCIIRRSRGYVPRPVDLKVNAEGILALGAEEKNSFCIGKNNQAVMSQYIGDLKNLSSYEFFIESITRFSELFRFSPKYLACDLHPDYLSSKHAEALQNNLEIPLLRVQHHHAHIVSCMAENGLNERVIGISLDGTGYGTDGRIWGGEFLIADPAHFVRYTHFDYVPMPGGDKAVSEPWRMAYSYLYRYFGDTIDYYKIPAFRNIDEQKLSLVRDIIRSGVNSPESSGAGRLFDAVSAILGLCTISAFDSEAPMRLESVLKNGTDAFYPFSISGKVIFAETLKSILSEMGCIEISVIAAKFHNTIARVILEVSELIRDETSINKVILSGGVFQNRYLTGTAIRLLKNRKFEVFTNHLVPVNDGGISLGQLMIASKRFETCA